jgi:ABC-type transport system substrate-binding protein
MSGGVLRVGLLSPIAGLDPREVQEHLSVLFMRQLFESPYKSRKTGGDVEPQLFAAPLRMERGRDGTVCRGRLRADARFSDGSPVTPEQVASALNRVEAVREICTVFAEGDEICFNVEGATDRVETVLGLRWSAIVLERDERILGTGPYAVAEPTGDEAIRLVRNEHHPQPAPIDEVHFVVYPPDSEGRPTALCEAIAAGDVDFTNVLPREAVSGLTGVRKLFRPGSSVALLYLNTEHPWLSKREVRQALALGIDRHQIASLSYSNPAAFIARSVLPPAMTNHRVRARTDIRAAREILAEFPPPSEPLRMLIVWAPRPYLPNPHAMAAELARQLEPLGVRLDIQQETTPEQYFERVRRSDYDLVLCGWMADTPDPADFLEALLASQMIPVMNKSAVIASNIARWADPKMDQFLAAFRSDPTEANLVAALDHVAEEVPLLPLTYGATTVVHRWELRGFSPDDDLEPAFATLDLDR